MKYLNRGPLFILKKLSLESSKGSKDYKTLDFHKDLDYGYKVLDCLINFEKEKRLKVVSAKIPALFFETETGALFEPDFDTEGNARGGSIDEDGLEATNWFGLGEVLYKKAEADIAEGSFAGHQVQDDFFLTPEDLLTLANSYKAESVQRNLFQYLLLTISLSKKQQEALHEFLGNYTQAFQEDRLERQEAEDFYAYKIQKEILSSYVHEVKRQYPLKNLFVDEEKISEASFLLFSSYDLKKFRLLEALMAFEKESLESGGGPPLFIIESLDSKKGVKVSEMDEQDLGLPTPTTYDDKLDSLMKKIEPQLMAGKKFVWFCRICTDFLAEFKDISTLKPIFTGRESRKCKNGHNNYLSIDSSSGEIVLEVRIKPLDKRLYRDSEKNTPTKVDKVEKAANIEPSSSN